jgi:hypothetical protein
MMVQKLVGMCDASFPEFCVWAQTGLFSGFFKFGSCRHSVGLHLNMAASRCERSSTPKSQYDLKMCSFPPKSAKIVCFKFWVAHTILRAKMHLRALLRTWSGSDKLRFLMAGFILTCNVRPDLQDVNVYVSELEEGRVLSYDLRPGRQVYFICIEGRIRVNAALLTARDAARITSSATSAALRLENPDKASSHM